MRGTLAQRGILRQRTTPYLGAACLALFALASAQVLPVELARFAAGQTLSLPPTVWLAGSVARPDALARSTALTARHTPLAPHSADRVLASAAEPLAPTACSLRPEVTWLSRGMLATPALLVAIALALSH